MRYWWVNQNQTYRHEIAGGYLWSPKRKTNGQRNPFYEFMREVTPGDIVFSFRDARISAIGIARTYCFESPKPLEFGTAGAYWEKIGWRVNVAFREIVGRVRPKDHIDRLKSTLPAKYSPLTPDGDGLQSVYLAEIGAAFAQELFHLIGDEANQVRTTASAISKVEKETPAPELVLEEWEMHVEGTIAADALLADTERRALILARRGQGRFRENVQTIERACRVTKVDKLEHLIASHARPWRDCETHEQRLDGENGLLLTPTIDHLFDKGFISFDNNGDLLISPVADIASLQRMGVATSSKTNVGKFSEGQRHYLAYHRENVLRMASGR